MPDAATIAADPQPPASVTAITLGPQDRLSEALKSALRDSMAMCGRLERAAFNIQGFSGQKMRVFFNSIMNHLGDARYLEIGLFHGASFCAALNNNRLHAVGIDNWSEFNGERSKFEANLSAFKGADADVTIIEENFRKIDYTSIGKFNIMFYDGSHTEQDQYDGVKYPMEAMDDKFILLIDDWNWDGVRIGTFRALRDLNASVDYSLEIRTSSDGKLPAVRGAGSEWHNGLFGAVISKSS